MIQLDKQITQKQQVLQRKLWVQVILKTIFLSNKQPYTANSSQKICKNCDANLILFFLRSSKKYKLVLCVSMLAPHECSALLLCELFVVIHKLAIGQVCALDAHVTFVAFCAAYAACTFVAPTTAYTVGTPIATIAVCAILTPLAHCAVITLFTIKAAFTVIAPCVAHLVNIFVLFFTLIVFIIGLF